jgi:hypothetical protein
MDTGSPAWVSPTGKTSPGRPAVLPGAILRATAVSKGSGAAANFDGDFLADARGGDESGRKYHRGHLGPGEVFAVQIAQGRQVSIARLRIDGLGDEIGASGQHIAAKHALNVGTGLRDQSLEVDACAVFLEIARERDSDIVILDGIGGEFDECSQSRQLSLHDFCAGLLELRQRERRQALDFRGKIGEPVIADDAEAHSSERCGVQLLPVSGYHRIEQCEIGHAARVRSDLIEERGDGHAAARGVSPGGRSETGNAAKSRGHADGPFRVFGDAEGGEMSRNRGGGAAAAAAGYAREIVGIVHGAERQIVAGPSIGQFVQIGLAEHQGARLAQSAPPRAHPPRGGNGAAPACRPWSGSRAC